MATIRTLVTKVVLDARAAVKDLKAYDRLWKSIERSVESASRTIERSADRAIAALSRVGDAAANARAGVGGVRLGGGGGSSGRMRNPEAAAVRAAEQARRNQERLAQRVAREEEKAARDAERRQKQQDREAAARAHARARESARTGDPIAGFARSSAAQGGLAFGASVLTRNAEALAKNATAAQKAKAALADHQATVDRNRTAIAALRAEVVRSGDADGVLAARIKGIQTATLSLLPNLQSLKREVSAYDREADRAARNTMGLQRGFGALGVAAGNLLSTGIQRVLGGTAGLIGDATKQAMGFETALQDVAKVASDADLKNGLLDPRVKQGIKDVSRELGVLPEDVAKLTAQITASFSGKTDIVKLAQDVTKIGVAWGVSGQQAGEYFKQTASGLQLDADRTKALFGTINELGNRLGVNSSEVAEAITRSAGVLKGANITGETGAALNAALIKAGATAEVAATGVRTFIARLGAGEAATDKQRKAFETLGLSAEKVAKELASGDAARAEKQIREVVESLVALDKTAPEKKMSTLIELFGSESIGTIGALSSNVQLLGDAFGIAGDKASALKSVQAEYDRVSNTSAARVAKLKASLSVLAIEFGEALLPELNRITEWLTSPEGQEWGRGAVEGLVGAVKSVVAGLQEAWPVIQSVGSAVAGFSEMIGGANVAVIAFGAALTSLLGPYGAVLAASTALGAYIAQDYIDSYQAAIDKQQQFDSNMQDVASSLAANRGFFGTTSDILVQMADRTDRAGRSWAEWMLRIVGTTQALDEFYAKERENMVRNGRLKEEDARRQAVAADRLAYDSRTRSAREADHAARARNAAAIGERAGAVEEFRELSARKRAGAPLRASEEKRLRQLTKGLDEARVTKGKAHKATKMDRQLAAMDDDVASVLRRGGERDSGGDLKVANNLLDKAVYQRATGGSGGGSGASLGPGPNITNNYTYITTTVQQAIDARGPDGAAGNLAAAGNAVAERAGEAVSAVGVRFTGASRLVAARNAGGFMRGPG